MRIVEQYAEKHPRVSGEYDLRLPSGKVEVETPPRERGIPTYSSAPTWEKRNTPA